VHQLVNAAMTQVEENHYPDIRGKHIPRKGVFGRPMWDPYLHGTGALDNFCVLLDL
jgi:hypothetical protein